MLVLDTNMLIVFIIGSIDRNLLGKIKRVKEYNPDDYETLFTFIARFDEVVLLPNIISEVSNLFGQLWGDRRELCMTRLADLVRSSSEIYIRSSVAVIQPEYIRLGVTDTSILCFLDAYTYLLTADQDLYLAALCRNKNAQYFDELRG